MASDLDLHRLPLSHKKVAGLIWAKIVIIFLSFVEVTLKNRLNEVVLLSILLSRLV